MTTMLTYRNDERGVYSTLKLDSGEKIFISMGEDGLKIFKQGFFRLPTGIIWSSKDPQVLIDTFGDGKTVALRGFLDEAIVKIGACKNISEIKEILR